MKKLLLLLSALTLLLAVSGCSSETTKDDSESTDPVSLSLEEIIAKTYETTELDFPEFMNQELTKENQAYMLGVDTFDFVEGIASEPMMTSQAHSFVVFTVDEGSDIESIKEDIKANVDGRKWICVGVDPENIIVDNVGNILVLIMDEQSEAIHEAFLQVTQ